MVIRLKQKPVECRFWREVKKGEECCCGCEGVCTVGVLKSPTVEFCNRRCKANTTRPDHMFVFGVDYSKKASIWSKMKQYLRAEWSLLARGSVSEKVFNARMDACRSCDGLIKSADPVGHCGKCGCGMSSRASLTVKGKMPEAECPIKKW